MASRPTRPRIIEAENTRDAQALVAAQARMYSDAKILLAVRLGVVLALAVATGAVAAANASLRVAIGGGGGLALLLFSFVAGSVEKRLRTMAAMTQEEFDTKIFRLEWNSVLAERPSPSRVSKAARRYTGGREADWYTDTENTHRPYDVLICQSTNLGWGASMHRLWAWIMSIAGLTIAAVVLGGGVLAGLGWSDLLPTILIPSLAPVKELIEQVRLNFENARTKEATERKIADLWAEGMAGEATPSENQLRSIQDKILHYRLNNAFVPDWLDKIFHSRNEAAMRASVASCVGEAKRNGLG